MSDNFETARLSLHAITTDDAAFILELVNTPGWIKFIGERHVKSVKSAVDYIQNLVDNPDVTCWTVDWQESKTPIGIITFIQREFLPDPDIGFAFLPQYEKKGFAFEAVSEVLHYLTHQYPQILATVLKENMSSIRLLEKLGFRYDREIETDDEILSLYSVNKDKLSIDLLTKQFFSIFNNQNQQPDWTIIHELCIPEVIVIKKTKLEEEIYTLQTFIEPRIKILADGNLTNFKEWETSGQTHIAGNIAQRVSEYHKSGLLNGNYFEGSGNKFFQFIHTEAGWKISSIIWEDRIKAD